MVIKKQKTTQNKTESDKVENEDLNDRLLRVQAEFQNFQNRARTEKEQIIKFANAEVINALLPVLDNFKRATMHAPQTQDQQLSNWIIGITAIEKQFENVLQSLGVETIKSDPGQAFDHNLHEAISHEASDLPPDTIIATTQNGYKIQHKILRPAKVRVSSGPKVEIDSSQQ